MLKAQKYIWNLQEGAFRVMEEYNKSAAVQILAVFGTL